jgi:hypothetical protein
VALFPATSLASITILQLSVIDIVQFTCAADICVQENQVYDAVVAQESTTSVTLNETSSVTITMVSVIVTLSSKVGATIVTTGAIVSIIYDWLFNQFHQLPASCAVAVNVPLDEIPRIAQVTGCA